MFFHSDEARNIEQTVKRVLKDYLTSSLAAEPYASMFANYHGVDVVFGDDEATAASQVGKPFIVLRKAGCNTFRWSKVVDDDNYIGRRCEWTFGGEVVANGFSGAQVGAANPVASDTLLCDALFTLVEGEEGSEALADLGLEEATLVVSQEDVEDEGVRVNNIELKFTSFILPSYEPPEPLSAVNPAGRDDEQLSMLTEAECLHYEDLIHAPYGVAT